jgi:hypothetical protein
MICVVTALWLAGSAVSAQWLNYRVPGVPRTADGNVDLKAPVPKTPDGKPDLSGTWESGPGYFGDLAKDLKAGELLMHPWAEALVNERVANLHKDDLMVRCMPPGVPRINMGGNRNMPHPFKIVQTPALVVLLYETSTNQTFRQVFLDGRPLPTDPQPSWLGYSVGRWEGDTLVVRVTERFRRVDFGHLEIDITIDDPKAYLKPWRVKVPINLLPDTDLIETFCENEKDFGRMPGPQHP